MPQSYVQIGPDTDYTYDGFEGAADVALSALESGEPWNQAGVAVGGANMVLTGYGTAMMGGTTETLAIADTDLGFKNGVIRVGYTISSVGTPTTNPRVGFRIFKSGGSYPEAMFVQFGIANGIAASTWGLYKNVGAGNVLLATGTTGGPGYSVRDGAEHEMTIVMVDDNIEVYQDDRLVWDYTMTAPEATALNDATNSYANIQVHNSDRYTEFTFFEAYPLPVNKRRRTRARQIELFSTYINSAPTPVNLGASASQFAGQIDWDGGPIETLRVYLGKNGSPTDNFLVRIQSDSAGPSGTDLFSAQIPAASISSAINIIDIPVNQSFSAGTLWLIFSRTGAADAANYYTSHPGHFPSGVVWFTNPGWQSYPSGGNMFAAKFLLNDYKHEYYANQGPMPTFYCYFPLTTGGTNKGIAGIWNGSSQSVNIKSLYITKSQPTAVTGVQVQFDLKLTSTAHSGGTAVVPVSTDTNDALPSGITAAGNGFTLGTAQSTVWSYYVNNDESLPTGDQTLQTLLLMLNMAPASSEMKEFELQPNQGFNFIHNPSTALATQWGCTVVFTVGE